MFCAMRVVYEFMDKAIRPDIAFASWTAAIAAAFLFNISLLLREFFMGLRDYTIVQISLARLEAVV